MSFLDFTCYTQSPNPCLFCFFPHFFIRVTESGIMSSRLSQPVGQQPHSNVAIVKYKYHNKHFEIACYKNMVLSYRNGDITDLSNVLQIERIFSSVSHGKYASEKDLKSAFGKRTNEEIIQMILQHGVLQVAELERSAEHERIWKSVIDFVSENCVNPTTSRKYSFALIEKAIQAIGFSIRMDFSWKRQALLVVKKLIKEQPIPICRAQIKVRITSSADILKNLSPESYQLLSSETMDGQVAHTALIDTHVLHELNILKESHDLSFCILESAVVAEGDGGIDEIRLEDVKLQERHGAKKVTDVETVTTGICGLLSNAPRVKHPKEKHSHRPETKLTVKQGEAPPVSKCPESVADPELK
ncbi:SBDS-like protein [Perkinsela sp. CCAP 1560/4]|nr:SBDS-like protein [Perkinsela sp. CCAP 1560/4]|eukprot:KNH08052.1 SBDS-like protein [Perkinsela sp. CCAP 1560/4]